MITECLHSKDPQNITASLQGRKIYKDQCVKCFHEPKDQGGLYVCLKCYNGFCSDELAKHTKDHSHPLYIHVVMKQKINEQEKEVTITKLAIGKQGGALGGPEYETTYSIYCSQCKSFNFEGHEKFKPQIQSLANTESPFKKQAAIAWQVQINECEHTLTLVQQQKNKDLSKCVECDLSTNLWLCLTCGNIGCGRGNWDGTGGHSHGVKHFESTGHPLVVKLGTITPNGDASLYCYSCNEDVKDSYLADHLLNLGISITKQNKTEKTVTEMSIDLNLNFSLSRLADGDGKDGGKLKFGSGYTGIDNIGNSCYINSVLQCLGGLEQYKEQYGEKGGEHLKTCTRIPSNCFYCQVSKVFHYLNSQKYSTALTKSTIINSQEHTEQYQKCIRPYDFKLLIANGHAQFSTTHQQDALQYLQWLFDKLDKEEPKYGKVLSSNFGYESVNRLVCSGCGGYKQITEKTNQWKIPVVGPTENDIKNFYQSLEKESDKQLKTAKQNEDPEYSLDFDECLGVYRMGDSVSVKCPKCNKNMEFLSQRYFKSTPKYLLMVPNRFVIKDFMQKKLNAIIKVPQNLDIAEFLLCNSKVKGDLLEQGKGKAKKYSQENLAFLMEMGNDRNASIRALIANGDNAEAACNWIFENLDQDLSRPIQEEDEGQAVTVDEGSLNQIMELGFNKEQGTIALIKNKNVNDAIEWLFNCGGDVEAFKDLLKGSGSGNASQSNKVDNGPNQPLSNKYQLKAVVIHLGKTPTHGHYVAYVKKEGEWVLFNDNIVKVPKEPALGKGYVYLYEAV